MGVGDGGVFLLQAVDSQQPNVLQIRHSSTISAIIVHNDDNYLLCVNQKNDTLPNVEKKSQIMDTH